MKHIFTPATVCSKSIEFNLDDNNIVTNLKFTGGCPGTLKVISVVAEGKSAESLIKSFKSINCTSKGTSCVDQFTKALEEAINSNMVPSLKNTAAYLETIKQTALDGFVTVIANTSKDINMCNTALKAIDKQIPKSAVIELSDMPDGLNLVICPVCGTTLGRADNATDYDKFPYCTHCGQKIIVEGTIDEIDSSVLKPCPNRGHQNV